LAGNSILQSAIWIRWTYMVGDLERAGCRTLNLSRTLRLLNDHLSRLAYGMQQITVAAGSPPLGMQEPPE
jgi:hypothetical protein